jgi:hypothetical protein
MANSYVPEVNDRVQCPNPKGGLSPYTGTVTQVYIGFVKVVFDKAQGPGGIHAFAMTSPANLVLLSRPAKATDTLAERDAKGNAVWKAHGQVVPPHSNQVEQHWETEAVAAPHVGVTKTEDLPTQAGAHNEVHSAAAEATQQGPAPQAATSVTIKATLE